MGVGHIDRNSDNPERILSLGEQHEEVLWHHEEVAALSAPEVPRL